ncbi:MAG TPA: hypothetical protein VGM37_01440 [Armatimonadota bacterium]|jgi:lysophospholipase L1-like esterase
MSAPIVTNANALVGVISALQSARATGSEVSIIFQGDSTGTFPGPAPGNGARWLPKNRGLGSEIQRLLEGKYGRSGCYRQVSESSTNDAPVLMGGSTLTIWTTGGPVAMSPTLDATIPDGVVASPWKASRPVTLNMYTLPSHAAPSSRWTYYYKCTTVGSPAVMPATEPSWPTSSGTVTDANGSVWAFQGMYIGSNGVLLARPTDSVEDAPIPKGWSGSAGPAAPGGAWNWGFAEATPTDALRFHVQDCRKIQIVYGNYTGFTGSFSITADGVAVASCAVANVATRYPTQVTAVYDLGEQCDHVIDIVGLAGAGEIEGILTWTDDAAGVFFANQAIPGDSLAKVITRASNDERRRQLLLCDAMGHSPNLFLSLLGANDYGASSQATFAANAGTMAATCAGLGIPQIWVIPPAYGSDATGATLHAYHTAGANAALAANPNTTIIDCWNLWGGTSAAGIASGHFDSSDTTHFNRRGVQSLARAIVAAAGFDAPAITMAIMAQMTQGTVYAFDGHIASQIASSREGDTGPARFLTVLDTAGNPTDWTPYLASVQVDYVNGSTTISTAGSLTTALIAVGTPPVPGVLMPYPVGATEGKWTARLTCQLVGGGVFTMPFRPIWEVTK